MLLKNEGKRIPVILDRRQIFQRRRVISRRNMDLENKESR
jgi:hypothetical protein